MIDKSADFENERLLEVGRSGVLTLPANSDIDDILELIRTIFSGVSVHFSVITDSQQIEKFHVGKPLGNIERSQSICGHVVNNNRPMYIPDTSKKTALKKHPLVVKGPKIAFYAGAPVHGLHDMPLGTLCVIGKRPRDITSAEKKILESFSNMLARKIVPETASGQSGKLPDRIMAETKLCDELAKTLKKTRKKKTLKSALLYIRKLTPNNNNQFISSAAFQEVEQQILTRLSTFVTRITGFKAGFVGDEHYAVLMTGKFDQNNLNTIARRIHAVLGAPVKTRGGTVEPSNCIAAFLDQETINSAKEILDHCNTVVSRSRNTGKSVISVTKSEIVYSARLAAASTMIEDAIKKQTLSCHFQPVTNLQTMKLSGFEALMRWSEPVLGNFGAPDILDLCAQKGLQEQLDYSIFEIACNAAQKRQTIHKDGASIAINIDTNTLQSSRFVRTIKKILSRTKIDSNLIEIEITEHSLFQNHAAAIRNMEALIDMGITFALDDFGTGFSSLSHLQNLPFRKLKVDQTFVARVDDQKSLTLIQAMISAANLMGLETTGEGAETNKQVIVLRTLGCTNVQGYHISKPLPYKAFLDYTGMDFAPTVATPISPDLEVTEMNPAHASA